MTVQASSNAAPASYGDMDRAHHEVLELALTEFRAEVVVLFPINPISGDFVSPPRVKGNLLDPQDQAFEQPRSNGLGRRILAQRSVMVPNLSKAAQFRSDFTTRQGIESFIALTVFLPGRTRPLAVIYINFRKPQEFGPQDEGQRERFAARAATILHRAWLLERDENVAILGRDINQQLDDAETLFRLLDERIRDIIDTGNRFSLGVMEPGSDLIDVYSSTTRGSFQRRRASLEEFDRETILRGSTSKLPGRYGAAPMIFVPMLLRGMPLGFLAIEHDDANDYDVEDLRVVEVLR